MTILRVAFAISRLGVGGAEHQLTALVSALDPTRFAPTIICLKDPGPMVSAVASHVDVVSLGHMNGRDPRVVNSIAQTLRSRGSQVLHCTCFNATAWGRLAARRARIPVVTAEHSINRRNAIHWLQVRSANALLDPGTHAVVACARGQVPVLVAEGCAEDHIRVIYNGVNAGRFLKDTGARRRLREEAGVSKDDVVVVVVANLFPQKNQRLVVDSVARLVREGLPVRLWLVGEGPTRISLESQIAELGVGREVSMLGRRGDVPDLLSASDVIALTSAVETFPMSLLEGMASGLPVVATAVGGIPEMVLPKLTGELLAAGDLSALTSALRGLVTSPALRASYGGAGRLRMQQRFTEGAMVAEYESLLIEAAGHR
jgi:glycosyltransferase involved in cell wall biosynthesis